MKCESIGYRHQFNSLRFYIILCGNMQQPLATPDANHSHPLQIVSVHDAKWRMDEFMREGLIKFSYHPTHVGMVCQCLNALEAFFHQPLTNLRHALFYAPGLHFFQNLQRGFRETDGRPWRRAISGQAAPWLRRKRIPAPPSGRKDLPRQCGCRKPFSATEG